LRRTAVALRPWKKLDESVVVANPWWTYKRDRCLLPAGTEGVYHYVHTNGSSMVIPVGTDRKLLLVNQYRYLMGRESLEFPCGSVKDGATYEQTAREELTEETGFKAGTLREIGQFNPYNGVTDELCRVYLAAELLHVGSAPEETEEFEFLWQSPAELESRIRDGSLWDGMTIAAWALVRDLVGR
jgi:8-oxo-dGTP pyrophosphatase MutT (NUDIX family)